MFRALLRTFNAKRPRRVASLSQGEKAKIEALISNKEIAKTIGMKRYLINDEVSFEGEAELIGWDNRFICKGGLAIANSLAEEDGLDLVLMRKDPPVVRIMNYSKYLLKAAAASYADATRKNLNQDASLFNMKNTITDHDLHIKLNKIYNILKQLYRILIEIRVLKFDSTEEIERTKLLADKIRENIKGTTTLPPSTISIDHFKGFTRISIVPTVGKTTEKELEELVRNTELFDIAGASGYQERMMKKVRKIQSTPVIEEVYSDEDEIMQQLMNGEEGEDSFSFNGIPEEDMGENSTDKEIIDILGKELAYKVKKGRVKL